MQSSKNTTVSQGFAGTPSAQFKALCHAQDAAKLIRKAANRSHALATRPPIERLARRPMLPGTAEERSTRIARRRRLSVRAWLPDDMAGHFTEGGRAVMGALGNMFRDNAYQPMDIFAAFLARRANVGFTLVSRALSLARRLGLITCYGGGRRSNGRSRPNRYMLAIGWKRHLERLSTFARRLPLKTDALLRTAAAPPFPVPIGAAPHNTVAVFDEPAIKCTQFGERMDTTDLPPLSAFTQKVRSAFDIHVETVSIKAIEARRRKERGL